MQEIFDFLTDIAAHNDRQWFADNRARYDAALSLPLYHERRSTPTRDWTLFSPMTGWY